MSDFLPKVVTNLIEEWQRLPGIGPKTASRLTFFLLRSPDHRVQAFAQGLNQLKQKVRWCSVCFNITDMPVCALCQDSKRNKALLCVVSDALDTLAIERTGEYRGLYHVLQGEISPINGIGPDDLKINDLVQRIADSPVEEIIIATNPTMEGETTALYISRLLKDMPVKLTRIARGLPSGGDLEYADDLTLANALQNRRQFHYSS